MNPVNPYQPPQAFAPPSSPGKLPVRVTGMLTADDAVAALKAVRKWHPWRVVLLCLPMFALFAFAFKRGRLVAGPLPLALLIGAMLLLIASFRAKGRFAKTWNARAENQQPITWTFSDDGLMVEAAHSLHMHYWAGFASATITPDRVILSQQGGAMFNFVPRRLFDTEGDWLTVCQLLTGKLPVRHTGGG